MAGIVVFKSLRADARSDACRLVACNRGGARLQQQNAAFFALVKAVKEKGLAADDVFVDIPDERGKCYEYQ